MNKIQRAVWSAIWLAPLVGTAQQTASWNLKTNLLYDAAATINAGAEVRLGGRTSLDLPLNYNAWTFSENRKWNHFLAQPELRLWTRETFAGHFFGLHAHYAYYNIGNLPHGPFSTTMRDYRFEGQAVGVGASYGHRWNFRNPRWAVEASVGLGYAYLDYDKFACQKCGDLLAQQTKHYFGPTKAALNLILNLGERREREPREPRYRPVYVPETKPVAPVYAPAPVYEPVFAASFVAPEAEAVKVRSESGRAYLDFAVNRSEIVPDFRNNAAELRRIYATIDLVRNDPNVTITGIGITGYASPEGDFRSNRELSARRAEALRNHLGGVYGLPNRLFSVYGAGEDWVGLDSLVAGSYLFEKHRLLEVIRGREEADAREVRLHEIGGAEAYRRLLEEVYPRLRRSEYTIDYTVVPFTVEQGKQVIRTRPGSLSLNEMFLIAKTYPLGSEPFNEVFETAARVFPDSETANLNAAASALNRGDALTAARYLAKVRGRTAEYWNNAGVFAWLRGEKAAAATAFARAGSVGAGNAAELRRHMESLAREK